MIIDRPTPSQIPQLRSLWKEAFGDTEEFLDRFFRLSFAPERSRCVTQQGTVVAALYWFDCQWEGKSLAYFYAVATAKASRGQGLCRALLEDTNRHLQAEGYAGSILVPQEMALYAMYEKLGYRTCSYVREFTCAAALPAATLRCIDKAEYARLRRHLLPAGGVLQEEETLAMLNSYASFYAGEDFLLSAYCEEDKLTVCELLGYTDAAGCIVSALGCTQGKFRTPGSQRPFAMYRSLTDDPAPGYFGLALD